MFDVGLDTDEEEVIWMRKSDMEHPDGIHEPNLAKEIILFRRRRKENREARRETEGSQRPVSASDGLGQRPAWEPAYAFFCQETKIPKPFFWAKGPAKGRALGSAS